MRSFEEVGIALNEGRWDDFVALMRPLREKSENEASTGLASEHGRSVNLISALAVLSNDQARRAVHQILPAIGKLTHLSIEEAFGVMEFGAELGQSYWHAPARQLTPHFVSQPGLAVEVGERLRVDSGRTEAAMRIWAGAFASAAQGAAAKYVQSLTGGSARDSELLVNLTHFLDSADPAVQAELRPGEKALADLLLSSTANLGRAAWIALTQISSFSQAAMAHLSKALNSGNSDAAIAITNSLYHLTVPSYGANAEPLQNIVTRLLDLGLTDKDVRPYVDSAVDTLLSRASLRPHITPCVEELCRADVDIVDLFEESFGALANHRDDFVRLLSHWLLRPDATNASVRSVLGLCTSGRAPVGLDAASFVAQTPERRVKAARRLLALANHGPTVCQFVSTLADMSALGTDRFSLTQQMLDLAFAEYPAATAQFLKDKVAASPKTDPVAHVFRAVYANVLRWHRVLAKLPLRKELRPTDRELHALRSAKRRFGREVMRKAAQQSLFGTLFPTSHVAQGRKFATHTQFGPPKVTALVQSSHAVELPSSELADPMRGLLERRHLLRSAK